MNYSRGEMVDGKDRQAPVTDPYGWPYEPLHRAFYMTHWTEGYTWQDVIDQENTNGKTLHSAGRFFRG